MTALWEQALDEIAQGKRDAGKFVDDQVRTGTLLVEHAKKSVPDSFVKVPESTTRYDLLMFLCVVLRNAKNSGAQ